MKAGGGSGTASLLQPWQCFSPFERWRLLAILFLVGAVGHADRAILPLVLEQIKREYDVSDGMLGLLTGAPFALCFALSSLPLAALADRVGRKLTLILSMIVWTAMTVLCGFAVSLAMLFIARMGVGLGEGGANPPAHALIGDYFPPAQRTTAFAIHAASVTAGTLTATLIGGWFAGVYGWKAGFFSMAFLSVPALLLILLFIREPVRAAPTLAKPQASTETFLSLARDPAFRLIVGGVTVSALFSMGTLLFLPSYLIRILKQDLAAVAPLYGFAIAIGTVAGSLLAGLLANRLVRRDPRWLCYLPAIGSLVALVVAMGTFLAEDFRFFLIAILLLCLTLNATLPPTFTAIQAIAGSHRRASASAVMFVCTNAFALTIAPLMTGVLSDAFHGTAGALSLRYAMLIMSAALVPAAWLFWKAADPLRAYQNEIRP